MGPENDPDEKAYREWRGDHYYRQAEGKYIDHAGQHFDESTMREWFFKTRENEKIRDDEMDYREWRDQHYGRSDTGHFEDVSGNKYTDEYLHVEYEAVREREHEQARSR